MSKSQQTKQRFAREIESMMRTTALSKVRVADLCERLSVERRLFYYHFRDKYDLVAWIFEQDYLAGLDFGGPYSKAMFEEVHRRFMERRNFYKRAFEEDAQNSIYRYLVEFSIRSNEAALKRYLGVSKLAMNYKFEASHFSYGNIGCTIEWLKGNIDATPQQFSSFIFDCLPTTLKRAYEAQK